MHITDVKTVVTISQNGKTNKESKTISKNSDSVKKTTIVKMNTGEYTISIKNMNNSSIMSWIIIDGCLDKEYIVPANSTIKILAFDESKRKFIFNKSDNSENDYDGSDESGTVVVKCFKEKKYEYNTLWNDDDWVQKCQEYPILPQYPYYNNQPTYVYNNVIHDNCQINADATSNSEKQAYEKNKIIIRYLNNTTTSNNNTYNTIGGEKVSETSSIEKNKNNTNFEDDEYVFYFKLIEDNKLKRCPFCDSNVMINTGDLKMNGYDISADYYVSCTNEKCPMYYGTSIRFKSVQETRDSWNKSIRRS